ncbi:MAG: Gldg family protein [Clostridia bacterium]|nr:Gldg family protein [Clostridia bacterium]
MKMKSVNTKKLRYGGVTALLTALVIAAVIVGNVIFSALAQKFLWYADLTPELLFTLSDECVDLIANGDDTFENSSSPIEMVDKYRAEKREQDPSFRNEDLMINFIFCDEPDVWQSSELQKYVYETAKQLQEKFPDYIKITNHDIIWNPSAVSKYEGATTTSVIIECGTEYRVRALKDFYFYSSDSTTPWAYNGEKIFAAGILAVTRAETPIACLTINHGETVKDYPQLLMTLETAGYKVQALDLATSEIPADCRLIVVLDPQSDFRVADGVSAVNEIGKLEAFLDASNSMMVFMGSDTPLTQFESFLEDWGIVFDRKQEGGTYHPTMITDPSQSYYGNGGYTIEAEYVTDGGMGGKITEPLRQNVVPPAIVFEDAMSISYSEQFKMTHYQDENDSSIAYDYGWYSVDGVSRSIYDLFVTSENAVAMAGGSAYKKATASTPLKLMTVSMESKTTREDNFSSSTATSYVLACGSPAFVNTTVINNNAYGNNSFLEYALRAIGQEPVPVGLEFKPFGDYTIDTVTTAEATQYTVVLTVIPAVVALVAGVVVIVRRKNR